MHFVYVEQNKWSFQFIFCSFGSMSLSHFCRSPSDWSRSTTQNKYGKYEHHDLLLLFPHICARLFVCLFFFNFFLSTRLDLTIPSAVFFCCCSPFWCPLGFWCWVWCWFWCSYYQQRRLVPFDRKKGQQPHFNVIHFTWLPFTRSATLSKWYSSFMISRAICYGLLLVPN